VGAVRKLRGGDRAWEHGSLAGRGSRPLGEHPQGNLALWAGVPYASVTITLTVAVTPSDTSRTTW
jgi:hypothetical protein